MDFEWDEAKNRSNVNKHLIAFGEAVTIFRGKFLTNIDERSDFSEIRFRSLGRMTLLEGNTIILVVHTKRDDRTRIISARRANRKEKKKYNDYVQK